jgi:hypothetical protein
MKTNTLRLWLALGLAIPSAALAQSTVQLLEQQMAAQEKRLAEINARMIELDKDIEGQVARIVDHLDSVKDSTESGTKVINLQEDVIVALKKSIDAYRRQRDLRLAEMNRTYTQLSKEDLARDVAALDRRINDRVDQIVGLTKALAEDQGFQRYEYVHTGDITTQSETEAYRRNQRVASKTAGDEQKVIAGLEKSIEDLKRENANLERMMAFKQDEPEKQLLREQLRKNEETIEERRKQIGEIIGSGGGGEAPVASKEATHLKQLLAERKADIQKDFNELVRLNSERDAARIRLRNLKAQLKASGTGP